MHLICQKCSLYALSVLIDRKQRHFTTLTHPVIINAASPDMIEAAIEARTIKKIIPAIRDIFISAVSICPPFLIFCFLSVI